MKRRSPSVALIWMYQGKNADTRRAEIEAFDYSNFKVVTGMDQVSAETDLCIFWIDDDKPVTKSFIKEMTNPLIAGEDFRAILHFWSGNAISLPKTMLDSANIECNSENVQSLLRMLLPVLDVHDKGPTGRMHLAFSSTERLAPLSMDPVGFPS